VNDLLDLVALRTELESIPDPEVPVLSIGDLGVLRDVTQEGGRVVVVVTPTYSGCPAMDHIKDLIVEVAGAAGHSVEVRTVYSPAWTTDWMSDDARERLAAYGIAPPGPATVTITEPVRCPRCRSRRTEVVSRFGTTACKSLMRCRDCLEPFDHFKAI